MKRMIFVILLIGFVALAAAPAVAKPAEDAAKAFTMGQALLAKADFDGALEAFKSAARTEAENQEYAQQYAMLRQVARMRRDCPKERDGEKWAKMAGALRTFYHDYDLFSEALPLDTELHRRNPSPESAVLLAETQLALGMDSRTVELLAGLSPKQTSPRTEVLHGLALARMGQVDEAKKLIRKLRRVKDEEGPRYFYDLARVRALTGDSAGAFEALTRSFELTPPSQLDAFKAEVKEGADFSTLLASADFGEVMKTSSKVQESGCSKGAGCGKCPKRAGCAKKTADSTQKKP